MSEQEMSMDSRGAVPLPPGQVLRYVVLHHTGIGANGEQTPASADHFDLLLEVSEHHKLWTWRVMRPPESWATTPGSLAATRLPDHRRAYLDYQGPISGDRGQVRRVARGRACVQESEAGELRLQLEGDIHALIHLPL